MTLETGGRRVARRACQIQLGNCGPNCRLLQKIDISAAARKKVEWNLRHFIDHAPISPRQRLDTNMIPDILEDPYTLVSVPKPFGGAGASSWVSPVQRLSAKTVRQRTEVAVAVDGEGIYIYDVRAMSARVLHDHV